MTAPRLEIDLVKIRHNASTLVKRLGSLGISVTGVTKAALGAPQIGRALLQAGINELGGSRIENIETMRGAAVPASMTLVRSPMLSQVDRIIEFADTSFNTEIDIIGALSEAAQSARRRHGIVLMVELGDLREGIMPGDLENMVRKVLAMKNIDFKGIGTNLACRSGVSPDSKNMGELSALANSIEGTFKRTLSIISGGNSGNLNWALGGSDIGRVNNLRLGESILLGLEPLHRTPIESLYTDAITLVAEVIETKVKPSCPWGDIAQSAYGTTSPMLDRGPISQTILAIGQQDTDYAGLFPLQDIEILGASSDHLVLDTTRYPVSVGRELSFGVNYSALLRAMTSPYVAKIFNGSCDPNHLLSTSEYARSNAISLRPHS